MNRDKLPASACAEGAAYYNRFPTGQAFWDACDRPAWMLWAHARSLCPAPWAYVALAEIWAQDAVDGAARADAAAAWAADGAAAWAADAAAAWAAVGGRQCEDIRAALPWFPGFDKESA